VSDRWDVFISYARTDRDYAHGLAEALRAKGLNVWWDWDLIGGEDFRHRIRKVIDDTSRVLVLWSQASVASHFVIDEASEAKRQGKLVPLSIDGSMPPFGFGGIHTVEIRSLEEDIDDIVASLRGMQRPQKPAQDVARPAKTGGVTRRKAIGGLAAAVATLSVAGGAAGYVWWPAPRADRRMSTPTQAEELPDAEPSFANLRRTALVIANSDYVTLPRLYNPPVDARKIVTALEARGFNVIHNANLDAAAMHEAFKTFESVLSVNGGVGLVWYAGNAIHMEGRDLLLPLDAAYDATSQEISGAIDLTDLQRRITAQTTKKFSDNGSAVVYSASKGQVASDGIPGDSSPFTKAFLSALDASQGDLGDIFTDISLAMAPQPEGEPGRATRGVARLRAEKQWATVPGQTPAMEQTLTRKFYFNRPEHDADIGVMKIIILDSCRDNPFEARVSETTSTR